MGHWPRRWAAGVAMAILSSERSVRRAPRRDWFAALSRGSDQQVRCPTGRQGRAFCKSLAEVRARAVWVAAVAILAAGSGLAPAAAVPERVVVGFFTGGQAPFAAALLAREGLLAHRFQHFDVVVGRGTPLQLDRIATSSGAHWFPNERLVRYSAATNAQIGAAALHVEGVDGRGVQVAVVDTGIDATLPDLVGRVTNNFKVLSDARSGTGTVRDMGRGSNTDAGGGHGTAVASVVAADGSADATIKGVAPAADLIGYGAGAGLAVLGVLMAYDHALDPKLGVDVVNNSFGPEAWAPFLPDSPVNVATRALHDAGMAVVFAVGNAGEVMTQSPYSLPPWVVGVGSSTEKRGRAAHSSLGIPYDASTSAPLVKGRASYAGDRPGLYRPAVLAPGEAVRTACTTSNTLPTTTGCTGSGALTGTSFAAPHVSGLLALLRQVNPTINPDDARRVLEVTARPVRDAEHLAGAGYGEVDAQAAVRLARSPNFRTALARAGRTADARVLGARPWRVLSTDQAVFRVQDASAGAAETFDVTLPVPAGTEGLSLALATPLANAGITAFRTSDWTAEVFDAAGRFITSALPHPGSQGVYTILADLRGRSAAWGTWTVRLRAEVNSGDSPVDKAIGDESMLRYVMLSVSRLKAQRASGTPTGFRPTGQLLLPLRADPARASTGVRSPEGCNIDSSPQLVGRLGGVPAATCTTALSGSATTDPGRGSLPAVFTSAPFKQAAVIGGTGRTRLDVADSASFFANPPKLMCTWSVSDEKNTVLSASAEVECATATNGRTDSTFAMPLLKIPAGGSLRVSLRRTVTYSSTGRIFFDGATHGDVGFVLQTSR